MQIRRMVLRKHMATASGREVGMGKRETGEEIVSGFASRVSRCRIVAFLLHGVR